MHIEVDHVIVAANRIIFSLLLLLAQFNLFQVIDQRLIRGRAQDVDAHGNLCVAQSLDQGA